MCCIMVAPYLHICSFYAATSYLAFYNLQSRVKTFNPIDLQEMVRFFPIFSLLMIVFLMLVQLFFTIYA